MLLSAWCLMFFTAAPGGAAIAPVVFAVSAANGNSSSNLASVNTSGATLFVLVITSTNPLGTVAVTTTTPATSGWQVLAQYGTGSNASGYVTLAYCPGPATGTSQSFAITTTTGNYVNAVLGAFSGTRTDSTVLLSGSNNGSYTTGSTSLATGTSGTLAEAGDLVLAGWQNNDGVTSSPSINAGFLTPTFLSGSGWTTSAAMSYLTSSGTSAVNPTWTSSSNDNAATIAVFRPPAGGPPACLRSMALMGAGCR
jgi:hypothetical protein